MKAYVLIKIRAGEVGEVVHKLRKIDSVVEANMTFGPYDAIAVIESDNLSAIGNLIASEIQPIGGVELTLTCLTAEV